MNVHLDEALWIHGLQHVLPEDQQWPWECLATLDQRGEKEEHGDRPLDPQGQEEPSTAGQNPTPWSVQSHPLLSEAIADRSLGAGESGKSTILKQMRIIYSEGFHLDERKEVRQVIFSNMIVAFKIIAEEMREIGMDYEVPESHV